MRNAAELLLTFFAWTQSAAAIEMKPVEVSRGIYAVIGDLGAPTAENEGFNANLGFVVGDDAVAVIDSGPTVGAARALHRAIRQVTDKPVRWVINTNSQGHRWLGNRYFARLGARVIAHQRALALMREQGGMQLAAARELLGASASGTEIELPSLTFADRREIDLGGVRLQLRSFGPAHRPGDSVVWLPAERILFTGDIVYADRLLAVLPIGSSANWIKAFDAALGLGPDVIVPGHGGVTSPQQARKQTRDYLVHLHTALKPLVEEGISLPAALARIDQSAFAHLANFADLARRNAQQVYLDIERE